MTSLKEKLENALYEIQVLKENLNNYPIAPYVNQNIKRDLYKQNINRNLNKLVFCVIGIIIVVIVCLTLKN